MGKSSSDLSLAADKSRKSKETRDGNREDKKIKKKEKKKENAEPDTSGSSGLSKKPEEEMTSAVVEAEKSSKRKRKRDQRRGLEKGDEPLNSQDQEPASKLQAEDLQALEDKWQAMQQAMPRVLLRAAKEMPNKHDLDERLECRVDDMVDLSDELRANIKRGLGIETLFPVQSVLIPAIIRSAQVHRHAGHSFVPSMYERGGFRVPFAHDFCVSSPTGSGKTLAYAAAVVEILRQRPSRRLRALILVLSHELALQVDVLLGALMEGMSLRSAVISDPSQPNSKLALDLDDQNPPDVVVATPERLIQVLDFVAASRGLASDSKGAATTGTLPLLRHLEFLVMDEADHLIARPDWLERLFHDSFPWPLSAYRGTAAEPDVRPQRPVPSVLLPSLYPLQDTEGDDVEAGPITSRPEVGTFSPLPLLKLLFSATLTYQDPQQWAELQLTNPHFFVPVRQGLYRIPSSLQEYRVGVPEGLRVLMLMAVLDHFPMERALVFTNNHRTSRRVVQVLTAMSYSRSIDYYSPGKPEPLQRFRGGSLDVLVATDDLARGIDISGVDLVVNYDIPSHTVRYVHRAGRTARAGRPGVCVSLVDHGDDSFDQMVRFAHRAANRSIENLRFDLTAIRSRSDELEKVLASLVL